MRRQCHSSPQLSATIKARTSPLHPSLTQRVEEQDNVLSRGGEGRGGVSRGDGSFRSGGGSG